MAVALQAQDTIKIYIDTLGVEQLSVEPPLYRVSVRIQGYNEVSGSDIRLRITPQGGQRIVEADVAESLEETFWNVNVNGDSLGLTFIHVETMGPRVLSDDTAIFTFDVSGDLVNSFISVDFTSLEFLRDGDEIFIFPLNACNAEGVQFNPARVLNGKVLTPTGDSLADIIVRITSDGETFLQDTTDANGSYTFPEVPAMGAYELFVVGKVRPNNEPEPRSERIRGINIGDLVLTARDIVNSDTLGTALAVLAADVNNDGDVSVMDILRMQNYILFRTDEYPEGPYYKFFTEGESPVEVVSFPDNITADVETNFIIVKMGDVNFSSFN